MCISPIVDVAFQKSTTTAQLDASERKESHHSPVPWKGKVGGTNAQAIRSMLLDTPSMKEVMDAIPKECLRKNTFKSMSYAIMSVTLTIGIGYLAYTYIPMKLSLLSLLLWTAYAIVEGTVATGCWVVAHECGHNSFSDNKLLQDIVGYILHTSLLVPYFSWQRSHAVHHSRTNHLSEGETHCPPKAGEEPFFYVDDLHNDAFAIVNVIAHLLFGWPAYLLWGATGGPARGFSNHFIPTNKKLFPGAWGTKVLYSDAGILIFAYILYAWTSYEGSIVPVLLTYFMPYLVVNMWLVLYVYKYKMLCILCFIYTNCLLCMCLLSSYEWKESSQHHN